MIHAISAFAARKIFNQPDNKEKWYDTYGVRFAGILKTVVEDKHGILSWVFLNTDPTKLAEGEYQVDVWGKQGVLLYWITDKHPRGIVALANETDVIESARQIAELKPRAFLPPPHRPGRQTSTLRQEESIC